MRISDNDAAPGQTGANVRTLNAPKSSAPPIDCGTLYALRATLVSTPARRIVEQAGPDLFMSLPERALAKMFITDQWGVSPDLSRQEREEVEWLAEKVSTCTIPDGDDGWAVYLVQLQAERRYGPLLASELRWAAGRVGSTPLSWLRRRVDHAFAVALGERPLDEADGWAGDAGEVAA